MTRLAYPIFSSSLVLALGCAPAEDPVTIAETTPVTTATPSDTPVSASLASGATTAGQTPTALPSGGADQPTTCEVHTLGANTSVPDMLIVLDRSGSMNPGKGSATDRWGGSRDAIVDVTTRFDSNIKFGLMTFPEYSAQGQVDQCASGTVNVPVGMNSAAAIGTALSGMDANGRTPTAPSLTNALSVLGPVASGPDVRATPKYVLLVTDGDPNCSAAGTGRGVDQAARDATIQAIDALAAEGIKTFVVGFETAGTEFAAQLNLMAQAGDTGATEHRSVNSGADLSAVLAELAKQVASCSYVLNAPVADPNYVAVTVNGAPRALGNAANGWTLASNAQTVTLTGAACDEVKTGMTLQIEVQCQVVTVH